MVLTPPDILIIIILGFFTFNGFRNGFIKEAARILGMVSGYITANNFYDDLMPFLEIHISNPNILTVVSYLCVFCVTLVIINTLAMLLQKIFELILLGWLNRLLGTLLGLIKGILVVSIIIFILEIAFNAAAPLRSVVLEAALALVFGTLSVRVAETLTLLKGNPSSFATSCAILV